MGKMEETYKIYRMQIEEILRACRGSRARAGEIVAWFYGGGTSESWRKFLAKVSIKAPKSEVVSEFLASLAREKTK
jgi:hypothetical protein